MKILQAFRLDQDLITKLKEEATEESRSLTKQVEWILKQHLKNKAPEPANTISGDDLAGKRVDQDIIIEMFNRPEEEKRSIIQYLKKNGFTQEEVRGVGTCLIVPENSDIQRLIKAYKPIEDL